MKAVRFLWQRLPDVLVGALFAVILMLAWLQVMRRYVFDNPAVWTEEITRLLLVWATFIAAGAACRDGTLLGVDMLLRSLSPGLRRIMNVLINLIIIVVGLTFIFYGSVITDLAWSDTSTSLGLPRGLFYAPAILGGALMTLYAIANCVTALWTGSR